MAFTLNTPAVWRADDTTPVAIESALLELMRDQAHRGTFEAPARVLNLVVVTDRAGRDETAQRLDRISGENPTRTILVVIEPDRSTLDARASLALDADGSGVFRERVEMVCGEGVIDHLDTVVFPVLANDVGTVIWSPHGHTRAVDALCDLAETVLLDSHNYPDWHVAIGRMSELARRLAVSDLAWLRSTPWRERAAAAFDPDVWRRELPLINRVNVRMHPESMMSALLLLGWIASRLEWEPQLLECDEPGICHGRAGGPAGEVELTIEDDATMPVPGISGLTIGTTSGLTLALDRAAGGLRAQRTLADGEHHGWTVLGASRGEDGILLHGLTHALYPDELFAPALDVAAAFVGPASVRRSVGGRGDAS